MFGLFKKNKKLTVESQLENLQSVGVCLKEQFNIDTIIGLSEREWLESEPYSNILIAMGGTNESNDNFEFLSNNIWHLDTECIEDCGDYIYIAERMRDLANGELPIENIIDNIDIDNNEAWLSFTLDGKYYKWDLELQDDWLDTKVISNFVDILGERKTIGRYTFLDLGGQDCLIGFCTQTEFEKLRKITGLDFQWLC